MKLIDPTHDPWRTVGGDDGPMVTITPRDHRAARPARSGMRCASGWPTSVPVGVDVPNDADIEQLAADLPRLALVALHFPKLTDGRAYSQALLLRAALRLRRRDPRHRRRAGRHAAADAAHRLRRARAARRPGRWRARRARARLLRRRSTRATSSRPRPLFARRETPRASAERRDERDRPLRPRARPASTTASRNAVARAARRRRRRTPAASCRPPAWAPRTWCITDLIARHGLPIAVGDAGDRHAARARRWR